MRQWELIGITDNVPVMTQPAPRPEPPAIVEPKADEPVFFWTTDGALRLQSVSDAAVEVIGRSAGVSKGRDLLEVFGLEGPNASLLDAHIAALGGEIATFLLKGDRVSVRCRVGPVTDGLGKASGTYCVAMHIDDVDVRDDIDVRVHTERPAVA
jgi:PAS domain-containing protein